jgi:hypothetical protein
MVGLLDIAKLKDSVEIRGTNIEVNGITAFHIVMLFRLYPELRKLMTGMQDPDIIQSLVNQAPMAVADIIVMGTGGGNATGEERDRMVEAAQGLSVGEQYAILEKIGILTFPQGPKSFLDRVGAALGVQPGALGWAPATKSQPQSSVAFEPGDQNANAGTAPPKS